MLLFAGFLLIVQIFLLAIFSFFSFFNYLYGFASLKHPKIKKVQPSDRKVAIVIVSFNEEYVLDGTIQACEALSYANKLIVLADDSTDTQVIETLRQKAKSRGCSKTMGHPFIQEITTLSGQNINEPIEIWESSEFVLFHRPNNAGFKAGSLQKIHQYLNSRGIELMYLLDADWHPQQDAIERTMEVIESDENIAFIQTKRVSNPAGMSLFQKYITLVEEGCYYVDFVGRQVLGHPTLFSGCCTLFRLNAITQVGGFTPGHLTEDLDLTDRFWLNNWKGVYLENVINYGEVPFTYDHYRRQQERWAAGSARAFKEYFRPLLKTPNLGWVNKMAAIRQNAYFTTTLLAGLAIIIGMVTILWLILAWNSYAVEYYLYSLSTIKLPFVCIIYWCVLSNFVEPLIMILFKKRRYTDLFHLPIMIWHAWGVLPTYIVGNLKGLLGLELDWFRTPKFDRTQSKSTSRTPASIRYFNQCVLLGLCVFYFSEGWFFGWFDFFALILIPSFLLASVK